MTQSTLKPPRKPIPSTTLSATPAKAAHRPTHEEITERARALWEARGRPSGQDEAIWLEAEAQLKRG